MAYYNILTSAMCITSIRHTRLAHLFNFDLIQEIEPKVWGWHSFVGDCNNGGMLASLYLSMTLYTDTHGFLFGRGTHTQRHTHTHTHTHTHNILPPA